MRSGEKVGGGGFSLLLTVEVMNDADDADDNPLLLPPNAMAFTSIFFFSFFPFLLVSFGAFVGGIRLPFLFLCLISPQPASLSGRGMDCSCPRVITSLPTRT